MTRFVGLLVFPCVLLAHAEIRAEGRVEMEVIVPRNFAGTAQQEWYQLLTEARVDSLRIRSARTGDEIKIDVGGTPGRPLYRVYGQLTARNQLVLPGGKFSPSDGAKLATWVKRLREQGPDAAAGATGPFGLSRAELAGVNKLLSRPVGFSTDGEPRDVVIRKLRDGIDAPMFAEINLAGAFPDSDRVGQELRGMASGTVLAYVLRPAGLVFQPRRGTNGEIEIVVSKSAAVDLAWPVGLSATDRRQEFLPRLFEILPVEIRNVPISDALAAIGERLEVPILIDENSLLQERIDPAEVNVSLPAKKLSYSLVLRKLLFQARLKSELRVDEADQPFLWITTLRNR